MKVVPAKKDEKKKSGEVFLMHAADEMHADTVESLLRSYDIPVLKKRRETGGYLSITTGMNVYGVELYVPAELHKAAVALVRTRKADEKDKELLKAEEAYRRQRLIRIWLLIGIFYLPVIIWLIVRAIG